MYLVSATKVGINKNKVFETASYLVFLQWLKSNNYVCKPIKPYFAIVLNLSRLENPSKSTLFTLFLLMPSKTLKKIKKGNNVQVKNLQSSGAPETVVGFAATRIFGAAEGSAEEIARVLPRAAAINTHIAC